MNATMNVLTLGEMSEVNANKVNAASRGNANAGAIDAEQRVAQIRTASAEKSAIASDLGNKEDADSDVFSLSAAMKAIADMRVQAESNYQTYEVLGRKATRELMGDVYATWCSAKCSENYERFIASIRSELKQNDVKVKSSSKGSSLLIRYIFTKASDKQVHVYGRALDVAYDEKHILPHDFSKWVEDTSGGFEGIRSEAAANSEAASKVPTALSKCRSEHTIDTIDKIEWDGKEGYKVIIAFRNEDDTADLKDPCLSNEQKEATLVRYLTEKKKAEASTKPKKASKAVTNLVKEMELKVIEQQSIVDQLSLEIDMYSEQGKHCEDLRSMLHIENIKLIAISGSLKITKDALTG